MSELARQIAEAKARRARFAAAAIAQPVRPALAEHVFAEPVYRAPVVIPEKPATIAEPSPQDLQKQMFEDACLKVASALPLHWIKLTVCKKYGLKMNELTAHRRQRHACRSRMIGMWLAKETTDFSLPKIGRAFGNRDHSTVLNAIRRVGHLIETDPSVARDVEELREELAA